MLNTNDLPTEVQSLNIGLPTGYSKVFERGLTNITPWYFLDSDEFKAVYKGLRELYPNMLLIPFARRSDNDDVAGVIAHSNQHPSGHIAIIHMFASPDYAVDTTFSDFWDWFRAAINEMIETSQ